MGFAAGPTLDRYLGARAIRPVLLAWGGVGAAAWAAQVLRAAPEVLTDATPWPAALRVLLLPAVPALAFAAPAAAALGLAVAGRALAAEGVLPALAACGLRPRSLAQPFLRVALLAALLSALLSLAAEPWALRTLAADLPTLAAGLVEGRVAPGSVVAVAPGLEIHVSGGNGRDGWTDLLVVRREPGGGSLELFAHRGRFEGLSSGVPAVVLEEGMLRRVDGEGEVRGRFGRLRLAFGVEGASASVHRLIPAAAVAPPQAPLVPALLAPLTPHDRYLVLRRWVPPLQTLLFALWAAALALAGRSPARLGLALAAGILATHLLLRLLEPAAADGTLPPAAALLLPHLPAALAGGLALRRLYLTGPVC